MSAGQSMAELIIALDSKDSATALALARRLRPWVSWFKVGLELFISAGPGIVGALKDQDANVFLDLKLYDIPNTAAQAALACARLQADLLTVHCQGGLAMCEAVAAALGPLSWAPRVVGVTVLTSFKSSELPGMAGSADEHVACLAAIAAKAGLYGVVCSAAEAARIGQIAPGLARVCPGIRPQGSDRHDQARTVTPKAAVANGADYLVVGRPVTRASDPVAATVAILDEMKNGGEI